MRFRVFTEDDIFDLIEELGFDDPWVGYFKLNSVISTQSESGEYGVIELGLWYRKADEANQNQKDRVVSWV